MRTAGIVCEYNPFHWGHQKQIEKTREILGADTAIVCIMSGNYVQRGEPAAFDKWTRAAAAVQGGADLVLELPITMAVNAAGYFAHGAVKCLSSLGCVDALSFGSECGSVEKLTQTAMLLSSEDFEAALREELALGISFAAARTKALEKLGGDRAVLQQPNNALGVEYIRAIREHCDGIQPVTVMRDFSLKSAGEIRQLGAVPSWMGEVPHPECYGDGRMHSLENGQRAMLAVLRTLPEAAYQKMAFEAEGLWSKVMRECRRGSSLEEILMACKSKRYAYARLKRTLLCLFLGLDAEAMALEPPYLRVLAFNDRGRQILHEAGKTAKLPLVAGSVPKTEEAKQYFLMEQRATDLYGLFAPEGVTEPCGREKAHRPVYVSR